MGLGVITGSLSIVRTVLNYQTEAPDPAWGTIPCWYWRGWEVFFGIAAACIPTLRPGYKWLVVKLRNDFAKLGSGNTKPEPGLPTAKKWTPPKPSSLFRTSRKGTTGISTKTSVGEDFLPLQGLDRSMRTNTERSHPSNAEQAHYPKDPFGNERREALHIPGDISTHRPGHLKRLDSEAKVGGGFGAEEAEERV